MRRFYCPPENISKDKIIIRDRKEVHHIVNVMRAEKGDNVLVFDGQGNEYVAEIYRIDKDRIEIDNLERSRERARRIHITLACALPKRSKFDFIVEKATELGVDRIIPLETKRTEIKISGMRQEAKIKRWRSIAVNAAKQCQRSRLPEITAVRQMRDIFSVDKFELILIPALSGKRKKIPDVLSPRFTGRMLIIIGPEGDFTPDEVRYALSKGAEAVTLGEMVLKVDTAAISALAAIRCLLA